MIEELQIYEKLNSTTFIVEYESGFNLYNTVYNNYLFDYVIDKIKFVENYKHILIIKIN